MDLIERERAMLMTLKQYINKHGYSPTFRELGKLSGGVAPSTVKTIIESLAEKGYVTYVPKAPRTLRLTAKGRSFTYKPSKPEITLAKSTELKKPTPKTSRLAEAPGVTFDI